MKKTLVVLSLFSLHLIADDKKKEEKKVEPPKIAVEHLAEYYRADGVVAKAQAAITNAQSSFKDSQADLKSAVEMLQKDCGNKFIPYQDPQNTKSIYCAIKPADPEKK